MGRRRSDARWLLPALALLVLAVPTYFVLAVDDDGLFELGDGLGTPGTADIADDPVRPECDWASLFDADPTREEAKAAAEACGGVDAAFLEDQRASGKGLDDTTFSSGKNDDPVASWRWDSGNVPTKDDLSNVYTYATLNGLDELVLYAGVERLAPSGDSHIDFEFNQQAIALDREPPCDDDQSAGPGDGPPCEFEGERTVGDLLVVMNFEQGGDLGVVEIRRWDGVAFLLTETLGGEGCNGDDSVCAFNNGAEIDGGPWPNYDSKGKVVDTLERNAFTEIGVNVTSLFDGTPCFFSVQAKSRSSSSFNSTLKDFGQTSFELCSFDIVKYGSPANPDGNRSKRGDDFIFSYYLENTGVAPLELVEVVDTFLGDITDEALAAGCGVLPVGGSCGSPPPESDDEATAEEEQDSEDAGTDTDFDIPSSVPDDADDPFDTGVSATYGGFSLGDAGEALVTVTATDQFPLNLFQPSVSVSKTGDTLSTPGNVVQYTIEVTNTSSDDSPDLANGIIVDSLLGDLLDPANAYRTGGDCTETLAVGATCTILAERTVRSTDPDPLPNTVDVSYNPAGGYPNVIADSDDHSVDLVYPDMTLSIDATPTEAAPGDVVTYTYTLTNTGDVDLLEIEVMDTLNGDLSDLFPDVLVPGQVAVVTVQYTVPLDARGEILNEATASYQVSGLPNVITATASFVVDVIELCALSPGFWKGGDGAPKWDDLLEDYIAQNAGFEHATVFPWLDPSLAGSTYWDVINFSAQGDVTRQLSFKYIAARLNEATFGLRQKDKDLLAEIDVYLAANPVGSDPKGPAGKEGDALLARLNGYFAEVGEQDCPPPDEF